MTLRKDKPEPEPAPRPPWMPGSDKRPNPIGLVWMGWPRGGWVDVEVEQRERQRIEALESKWQAEREARNALAQDDPMLQRISEIERRLEGHSDQS